MRMEGAGKVEMRIRNDKEHVWYERTIHTPAGDLHDVIQWPRPNTGFGDGPNPHRIEPLVKSAADLDALGLLEKTEAHRLMVPRGDRSGTVVEPYLTDQWYVRTDPLARAAIAAVEDGRIEFVPANWSKTYYQWMHNIQDWCISRQLWWGHRIPAWYDDQGNVYVGRTIQDVREQHGLSDAVELRQDDDVLDTWFSSALWPFSTLGWPQQTDRVKTFYPTSVLVTGFDIISPPDVLASARWLAWTDVINAGTWILVVIVLEVEVRLQLRGNLSDQIMAMTEWLKFALYGILFVAAGYWGIAGSFLDFWDAFLWLVKIKDQIRD